MDLITILPWIQIVVSVVLIALILLQNQDEAGLGGVFGGSDGGGGRHIRRGFEKTLFQITIAVSIFFAIISSIYLFI